VAWGGECIDVWAMPEGKRKRTLGAFEDTFFAVHPSGRFVFVAGKQPLQAILIVDERVEVASRTTDQIDRVIASPNGNWVIGMSERQRALYGYQWGADEKLRRAWTRGSSGYREFPCGFVDGDRFVSVGGALVVVRDAATGEVRSTAEYPSGYVIHAATSPDGSKFASMGWEKLYVWDTAVWGKPRRVDFTGGRRLTSFAFHPTRPLFAAIQGGQTLVKFFDTVSWKLASRFAWKLGEMRCVAFSPDGTLAAAGSASGKIVVWDVD